MTRHAVRPYHLFAAIIAGIVIAIPIEPFDAPLVDARNRTRGCLILATWHNDVRRVGRPVNVECRGIHAQDDHRGNWGVASHRSRPVDGFQFAGWDRRDGWLTWQSCTRNYPPPNGTHYNDPSTGYSTQKAHPDNDRIYGYEADRGASRRSCQAINKGVYTFLDNYMTLYELDWPDGDDKVADLIYGDISVPVTCSGPWNCSGSSAWISPIPGRSSTNASANIQIRVNMF